MTTVIETDVLVIGGGGAASRAAIEAHRSGAKTTIVVKGRFGMRGLRGTGATSYSRTNFIYFPIAGREVGPDEECEVIYRRIIQAGLGLADRNLARALVEDGRKVRETLEKWGVVHPPTEAPSVFAEGISRWIDPMPGLGHVVRASGDIKVIEHSMITDLLIQDGMCVGAMGIGEKTGEPFMVKAHSTIIGTGGNAQLFRAHFHPSCVTGDGYALGYNAGAELMNMEFMQVFPTTGYPTSNHLSWVVWEEPPKIVNANGEEFIQNYLPDGVTYEECVKQHCTHGPFSTSDLSKYIEVATVNEIKAGRGNEHDACYIDINALKRISELYQQWFSYRGIDFDKEYSEFSAAHHCSNGGLRIDENGQTTIPGLYAAGEAATGSHGADRLGGAMMALSQIFGRRAGIHAAETAKGKRLPDVTAVATEPQAKRISQLKESKGDQKPSSLVKMLQKITWENLLVVRNDEGLREVLAEIDRIRNELMPSLSIETPQELTQALELTNLLQVGEIMTNAALMRTESRGGFYRDDYTERDDANWAQVITIKKSDEKMEFEKVKIDPEWSDNPDDFGKGFWG